MIFPKKLVFCFWQTVREILRIAAKILVAAVLAAAPFFPHFDIFYLSPRDWFTWGLWTLFFGFFLYFFFVKLKP